MDRSISHCSALSSSGFRNLILVAGLTLVAASTTAVASEPCGTGMYPFPYTDVSGVAAPFCPGIMEAYVTGISKGTTPTTFSPNADVTRVAMTTFLQRTVDQVLTRGSRRAALNQWWTPQNANKMQTINVGGFPQNCAADGEYIWTTIGSDVVQVQASTGAKLGTWTGAASSNGVLAAAGKVFVTDASLNTLYVIDPTQAPGAVTVATSSLGANPTSITFDGTNLWTANYANGNPGGSVSIIDPTTYAVTTVTTGFSNPWGILYDGTHIWVTDNGSGKLFKLDASGNIIQTVIVGRVPNYAVFDGANIWVPNFLDSSITVVQASTGKVVATIMHDGTNMLNVPWSASFDGERILVTNYSGASVSVFKAADLSFIANVSTGASSNPTGVCSDGIYFWIDLFGAGNLLRF